jgi:hypothetical protein
VAIVLVVAFAAIMAIATPLGFCGDGVPDYGTEQCDSGMRCVSRQNTLQWAGVGPSMGPLGIALSFQYAVQDYQGVGIGQPLYGLQINSGAVTNQYPYLLVCSQVNSSVISLTVEPDVADVEMATQSAIVQWLLSGGDCADASRWNSGGVQVIEFSFRWIGEVPSDVWLATAGEHTGVAITPSANAFSDNNVCGTECCTFDCRRTWATAKQGLCPLGSLAGAVNDGDAWSCQRSGACELGPVPVDPEALVTCGDGYVTPPEQCDTGIWQGLFDTALGGAWALAPGSNLTGIEARFYWQVLSTAVTYTNYLPGTSYAVGTYFDAESMTTSSIFVANQTYVFRCQLLPGDILVFRYGPLLQNALYPQVMVEYYYPTGAPGVSCANWISYLAFIILDHTRASYTDWTGTSNFTSMASLNTIWGIFPNPEGTACCTPGCNLSPYPPLYGTPCQIGTPQTVPETPTWQCTDDGVCTSSPSASISHTPSMTPSPSNTATVGASPSITPSPSITSSPSESPSTTRSASLTPPSSITSSPSASTGSSPSPTSSPSASGTGTSQPSASNTASPGSSASPTRTGSTAPAPSSAATDLSTVWALVGTSIGLGVGELLLLIMLALVLAMILRNHLRSQRRPHTA